MNDKCYSFKISNVCFSLHTTNKVKRPNTNWKEIFIAYIVNERLLYNMHKGAIIKHKETEKLKKIDKGGKINDQNT